ncbi:PAS domain S-box-containing protein [Thermonema lapsum]|uniref:PAS domain S-box-containing protein n=1 Tax=Thermonema lapsum TaxID=28195 RepID=A0A846MLV9_9BACT|nr:PAS domain S-box protein [Thermonema lapsum]NIK72523.1 PAS domain S-box-containing protein [Thermonema lapsum]
MSQKNTSLLSSILLIGLAISALLLILYAWLSTSWNVWLFTVILALMAIAALGLHQSLQRLVFHPLKKIKQFFSVQSIDAELPLAEFADIDKQVYELVKKLQEVSESRKQAARLIEAIGQGNYDASIEGLQVFEGIGQALMRMRDQLKQLNEERERRTWAVSGLAEFNNLLREHQNDRIEDLAFAFLHKLVEYVQAHQGAVHLVQQDENPPYIHTVAAYAFQRRKYLQKRFELKEGLVGRCVLENDLIYIDDIPEDYPKIVSGLSEGKPKCILLSPIRHNDRVYGVVEIASLRPLPAHVRQFIEDVSQTFGSSIANALNKERTERLLRQYEQTAKELQEKEATLMHNTAELERTKRILEEKMREVERESMLTNSILNAVNKTNSMLELDLEGRITDVNDIYTSLTGYSKEELIGKPESMLLPPNEQNSLRYSMMWEAVKTGSYISGEFRRIAKNGKELWLSATYSPIFDVNNQVYKIVQFGQFTTEQKEKEQEYDSKIKAIDEAVALVEIGKDGVLLRANPRFMQEFGFQSRMEVRRTRFAGLLDLQDVDDFNELWQQALKGTPAHYIYRLYTRTGDLRHYRCSFSPVRNLNGEVYKVVAILVDVTELQKLRQQLQQSLKEERRQNVLMNMQMTTTEDFAEQLAQMLLENSNNIEKEFSNKSVPVIRINRLGEILSVNIMATRLLGYDARQLQHKPIQKFLLFHSQVEQDYFRAKINMPEMAQLKLSVRLDEYNTTTFNVVLVPQYPHPNNPQEFDMVMLFVAIEPTDTF